MDTSDRNEHENKLKKNISLLSSMTLIIGTVIGSGIFISSPSVLKQTGSVGLSILVWINCGILSLMGAICYAELGTMIPSSGGDYIYIMRAFGSFAGFIRIWVEVMVIRPSLNAIVSLTFAIYLLKPIYPVCDAKKSVVLLLGNLCLIIVTTINCLSVKASTIIQDIFSIVKILALLSIIFKGFYNLATGDLNTLKMGFDDTTRDFSLIALAHYGGLFSYNGWQFLNTVAEEMKNVKRDLPVSLFFSIFFIMVVYVLAIVAYYSEMGIEEIINSKAIALTFGKKTHPIFGYVLAAGVACSTFGAVNGITFSTSRLFFVAARNGHMPKIINTINLKFNTPVVATIATGLLSMCYTLAGDIEVLLNYTSIMNWLAVIICLIGMIHLRKKEPNTNRPIKAPIAIAIIFNLIVGSLIIASVVAAPVEAGIGFLITATAIPVYLIFKLAANHPKVMNKIDSIQLHLAAIVMSSMEIS